MRMHAHLGFSGSVDSTGTGVDWQRKLTPLKVELTGATVWYRIAANLPATEDELVINTTTGVATPSGTAALTIGGAGKNREGATIPTLTKMLGVLVTCTAGSIEVAPGSGTFDLAAGQYFLAASEVGNLYSFLTTGFAVTALANNSAVDIEVVGAP